MQIEMAKLNKRNREQLEAVARMSMEMKRELAPRMPKKILSRRDLNEIVRCYKNLKEGERVVTARIDSFFAGFIEYFMNDVHRCVDGRSLFVCPDFRGKGIARALMDKRTAEARMRGYNSIKINASESAQKIFSRYGFVKVGSEQDDDRMILRL